jgi:hypothetical protein
VNDWQHSQHQTGAESDDAAAGAKRQVDPETMLVPRLGRNLSAGFRLAFIRRVSVEQFRVDFAQIVALFIVNATAAGLSGYLIIDPPRKFNIYGVTGYATHLLVFIVAVLSTAAWLGKSDRRSALFVTLLSSWLTLQMVALPFTAVIMRELVTNISPWAIWAYFISIALWTVVVAGRAMRLVSGWPPLKLALPVSGYALIFYGMTFVIPSQETWYSLSDYSDESASYTPQFVDPESTYYDQGRLMHASLEGLETERPGVSDLYFVGFANDAHQDVFRKEIELARALLDERFDTAGRSMMLINNAATVEQVPLANRPNLSLALNAIGRRMNTDEDVLFLFLTSHGSPDGVLAARFWPLRPNDLSSADLKQLLDRSGIRWRILVVSACYSGTFIDPLKDERTLILTASRKDRNSFGCSNDREYTYFGEHFFARELGSGKSLLEAFEAARISLAERERSEGYLPSEPQMHVGELMRGKLAEIEARLSRP